MENVSSKFTKVLKAMYNTVRAVIKQNGNMSECIYSHLGGKTG